MECLIAMGIFAIGVIAVAAVFPTAIVVQRETVRSLQGQRVADNAAAMMQALAGGHTPQFAGAALPLISYHHDTTTSVPPRGGTLANYTFDNDPPAASAGAMGRVFPMLSYPDPYFGAGTALPSPNPFNSVITLAMTGDATERTVVGLPTTANPALYCDYYWAPFIQPINGGSGADPTWKLYVMVMKGGADGTIPEPRVVPIKIDPNNNLRLLFDTGGGTWNDQDGDGRGDWIQPGDWVLTDIGDVYKVATAQPDGITLVTPLPPYTAATEPRFLFYAKDVGENDTTGDDDDSRNQRSPIARIEVYSLLVPDPTP